MARRAGGNEGRPQESQPLIRIHPRPYSRACSQCPRFVWMVAAGDASVPATHPHNPRPYGMRPIVWFMFVVYEDAVRRIRW